MDWKEKYGDQLISPEEATKMVKSGDKIIVEGISHIASTLGTALGNRTNELEKVTVCQALPGIEWPWHKAENTKAFTAWTPFLSQTDRPVLQRREMDYQETISGTVIKNVEREQVCFDVAMMHLAPPDKDGYCSYGQSIWWYPSWLERTKLIIAEINPKIIRPCGHRGLHISRIGHLVEHEPFSLDVDAIAGMPRSIIRPLPSQEEADCIEVIAALCAHEIVNDRDTIQLGVGTVSPAVVLHLYEKHDLGMATEVIPEGTIDLVKAGVVTGKFRSIHQGKVTGTALSLDKLENLAWADRNPVFELYDWAYISDPRTIAANDNMVCINTVLGIDLWGQMVAHQLRGFRYAGVGGQLEFTLGAQWSKGGRSVMCCLSWADTPEGRVSRIVPEFPVGTIITTPRCLADYVVTEYGIANLLGKTDRQRFEELIAIAHPDFRAELRKAAQKMLYP